MQSNNRGRVDNDPPKTLSVTDLIRKLVLIQNNGLKTVELNDEGAMRKSQNVPGPSYRLHHATCILRILLHYSI